MVAVAKTVEIDGEIYRKINGKWVDSLYLVPALDALQKIVRASCDFESLEKYSNDELEEFIKEFKSYQLYSEGARVVDVLYARYCEKRDLDKIRWILPVSTSIYRSMGSSQLSIDFYKQAITQHGSYVNSPALLTSVAAACCDVGNYEAAKKLCDRAYATGGYSIELSGVYERIKAWYKK